MAYKLNLNRVVTCPECKEAPASLVEEIADGDLVCANCGLVLENRLFDDRRVWRDCTGTEFVDHGLPSFLEFPRGPLAPAAKIKLDAQVEAYETISRICTAMRLDQKTMDGAYYFYKAIDKVRPGGRSRNRWETSAVIAVSIFHGCRTVGFPRTFWEVAGPCSVSRKDVSRMYREVEKRLDPETKNIDFRMPICISQQSTSATDIYSLLGLQSEHRVEIIAVRLVREALNIPDLAGRSSISIAAACIYMASLLNGKYPSIVRIATLLGAREGAVKVAFGFLNEKRSSFDHHRWLKEGNCNLKRVPKP